ncbi:MAG: NAD-dependent epimerase/dehydratase family protein [Pyrinomonadaceae bacterium]|nr:NAD-dependent epimerase/dehydratase family protein [Pyrinomonadaceae bacterium]
MRILVIGGTSFIGPRVVSKLVEQGHELAVFHRGQTKSDLPYGVEEITGERAALSNFSSEFKRFAPEVVLDMILFTEDEARTALQVFKGMARRFVMPSSMDVYRAYGRLLKLEQGAPDPIPYTEEGPLREVLYPYRSRAKSEDERAYSYDKILAERVMMSDDKLPATILRLPAVYGPGDKQHRLFEYLKPMDDGRPFILMGERRAEWLWSRGFVENVADAIALAVTTERAMGRIYNVAERDALTEREWLQSIARIAGWNGEILLLENSDMPEHLADDAPYENHLVSDSSRIRRELGFEERVGRDEALRQTIEWERENPPTEINQAQFDYAAEDAAVEKLKARESGVR